MRCWCAVSSKRWVPTCRPPAATMVLFSANPTFSAEIARGVRERWLAAWFYLDQRVPEAQWPHHPGHREALLRISGEVLQHALRANEPDEHLAELRRRVFGVFRRLCGALVASVADLPPARLLALILPLKTEAKTLRDQGATDYPDALAVLRQAITIAERGLQAARAPDLRRRFAQELADCHGIVGASSGAGPSLPNLASRPTRPEQLAHLQASVRRVRRGSRQSSGTRSTTSATPTTWSTG